RSAGLPPAIPQLPWSARPAPGVGWGSVAPPPRRPAHSWRSTSRRGCRRRPRGRRGSAPPRCSATREPAAGRSSNWRRSPSRAPAPRRGRRVHRRGSRCARCRGRWRCAALRPRRRPRSPAPRRGRAGCRRPRRREPRRSLPPEPNPSMAPSLFAQDLARIHYAVRVEGALHGAHERKLDRGGVALELAHLESPDAMLGTEAAAELVYQLVHGAPHAVGATEKALAVTARRLTDVEM